MADTTYNVRVVYHLNKDRAEGDANSLARTFDRVAAAVGGAFAVHRVLDFTKRVIDLQAWFENMRITLATMLVGFDAPGFTRGAASFKDAMSASAGLMDQIRKDAATLPGTAEDMMEIMRAAMPGGIRAGHAVMGQDSILKMSERLMAAGNLLQIPGGSVTVAREFQAMMEGRAQTRNDLFARIRGLMNGGAGLDAKAFNALTDEKKWQAVTEALTKLVDPALPAYAETWKAIGTSAKTWGQQIILVASGGVSDALKRQLKSINDYFVSNRQEIEATLKAFGDVAGSAVNNAFESLRTAMSYIVENRNTILEVAKAIGIFWVASKAGSYTGGGLGSTLVGNAGIGLGINALTGGNAATGGIMAVLSMLASFGGAVGAAATALVGLAAAANEAATAVDDAHRRGIQRDDQTARLNDLYAMYQKSGATGEAYAVVKQIVQENHLLGPNSKLNKDAYLAYLKRTSTIEPTLDPALHSFARPLFGLFQDVIDSIPYGPRGPSAQEAAMAKLYQAGKAVPEKKNVNVVVNIKQDISTSEDPGRLLVRTRQAIEDALIRPIESGSNRFAILR